MIIEILQASECHGHPLRNSVMNCAALISLTPNKMGDCLDVPPYFTMISCTVLSLSLQEWVQPPSSEGGLHFRAPKSSGVTDSSSLAFATSQNKFSVCYHCITSSLVAWCRVNRPITFSHQLRQPIGGIPCIFETPTKPNL